jgi:hypothetical protein
MKYKQIMPNNDHLSREDILGICLYIEQVSNKTTIDKMK